MSPRGTRTGGSGAGDSDFPGPVAAPSLAGPPTHVNLGAGDGPGRGGAGAGAFLLAIVTAAALAHVGVRLKGLEVAYDLGRERRVASELQEQRRQLQIEIGMLKDPGRVVAIARDKLKMGPPAPEAIQRRGTGGLLGASAGVNATTAPADVPKAGWKKP